MFRIVPVRQTALRLLVQLVHTGGWNSRAETGSFFFFFPASAQLFAYANTYVQKHFNRGSTFWIFALAVHMRSLCYAYLCPWHLRRSSWGACFRKNLRKILAKHMQCIWSTYKLMKTTMKIWSEDESSARPCIITLLVVFENMIVWVTLLAYAQHMRASSLTSNSFNHAVRTIFCDNAYRLWKAEGRAASEAKLHQSTSHISDLAARYVSAALTALPFLLTLVKYTRLDIDCRCKWSSVDILAPFLRQIWVFKWRISGGTYIQLHPLSPFL